MEVVDVAMTENWSFNVRYKLEEGLCEMLDVKQQKLLRQNLI